MRRYKHCATIPMAEGASEPTWPLPDTRPRFATWSICGGRPFGCDDACKRWHAGIDLVGAKGDALVVAPEPAVVVALDAPWTTGTRAVFLRTASGLFLVLGGVKKGSAAEFKRAKGEQLDAGDPIGRVVGSYGMIHFETYADAKSTRTHNSRWYLGDSPPEGLRNPLNYIQRAAGVPATLETDAQRQQALRDLGYDPDPVGEPWGSRSEEALKRAQEDLGLEPDGIWGEKTEKALRERLDEIIEQQAGSCDPDTVVGGCVLPPEPEDPKAPPTEPGSSKAIALAGGAVAVAAVVGGVFLLVRSIRSAPSAVETSSLRV